MNKITENEFFKVQKDGVKNIYTPDDEKIDIVEFDDKNYAALKAAWVIRRFTR